MLGNEEPLASGYRAGQWVVDGPGVDAPRVASLRRSGRVAIVSLMACAAVCVAVLAVSLTRPTAKAAPVPPSIWGASTAQSALDERVPLPPLRNQATEPAGAQVKRTVFVNAKDGYEMVYIPPGRAIFGSAYDDPDADDEERPQFRAQLPGYYLGIYCVTNAQYAKFLGEVEPSRSDLIKWISLDGCCHVVRREKGYAVDDEERYADHPVVMVSWYGAKAYCDWAGLQLPTELEWERGARGDYGRKYPWGNEWDPDRCRHDGNRGDEGTCRVGDYPEGISPWGLLNMSGNVWEWCADWYEETVYGRYATGDLDSPASGQSKVLRGGSGYYDDPVYFRCACRDDYEPSERDCFFGFRCARGL